MLAMLMDISRRHIGGNYIYATNFSTYRRRKLFAEESNAMLMIDCIMKGRELQNFWLLGFVVMPHHVHLIIKARNRDFPSCIGFLKGASAYIINKNAERTGILWQSSYFSRPIIEEYLLIKEIEYLENNPVRANLVDNPFQYKFSSAVMRNSLDMKMINEAVFWEEAPEINHSRQRFQPRD
ncbi:MAG: transposase [Actinobacteria bacterium]|nr:transposase [Actinomycetota bacterium]